MKRSREMTDVGMCMFRLSMMVQDARFLGQIVDPGHWGDNINVLRDKRDAATTPSTASYYNNRMLRMFESADHFIFNLEHNTGEGKLFNKAGIGCEFSTMRTALKHAAMVYFEHETKWLKYADPDTLAKFREILEL